MKQFFFLKCRCQCFLFLTPKLIAQDFNDFYYVMMPIAHKIQLKDSLLYLVVQLFEVRMPQSKHIDCMKFRKEKPALGKETSTKPQRPALGGKKVRQKIERLRVQILQIKNLYLLNPLESNSLQTQKKKYRIRPKNISTIS